MTEIFDRLWKKGQPPEPKTKKRGKKPKAQPKPIDKKQKADSWCNVNNDALFEVVGHLRIW